MPAPPPLLVSSAVADEESAARTKTTRSLSLVVSEEKGLWGVVPSSPRLRPLLDALPLLFGPLMSIRVLIQRVPASCACTRVVVLLLCVPKILFVVAVLVSQGLAPATDSVIGLMLASVKRTLSFSFLLLALLVTD